MLSFIGWLRSRSMYSENTEELSAVDKAIAGRDFPETVKLWEICEHLDKAKYSKSEIKYITTLYFAYIKYISHALPQY